MRPHPTQARTGTKINANAAGAQSEALKANTTLTTLGLRGEQEQREKYSIEDVTKTNNNKKGTALEQKEQEH